MSPRAGAVGPPARRCRSRQNRRHGVGGPETGPDLDECSDDRAHHVAKEPVTFDLHHHFVAALVDIETSDGAHGVERARSPRLERREIVTADEGRRRVPHSADVREVRDVPGERAIEWRHHERSRETVAIRLPARVKPRVKTGCGVFDLEDPNVDRQPHVDGSQEACRGQIDVQIHARHLRGGMHSRVRPAGSCHAWPPLGIVEQAAPRRLRSPAEPTARWSAAASRRSSSRRRRS